MRKLTSVLLIVCMAAALISGCDGTKYEGDQTNPVDANPTTMSTSSPTAETDVAYPTTSAPKKDNGIYGNTVVLGNITFTIPDGFIATAVNDKSFMLSSDDGKCAFGLFAADISELDEDKAKLYLPQQDEIFVTEGSVIGDIDTIDGFVAGYDVVMDFYGVWDGNKIITVMDGTFTDSWYAYTVMFRAESGDGLSDYITKFAEFTGFAIHDGTESRFDFVQ